MTEYNLMRGSSTNMEEVGDNSTHLIFTSPPYYRARDYSLAIKDDIGREEDYSDYLSELIKVWIECHRVLKPGGILAVNVDNTTVDGKIYPCAIDVFYDIQNNTPLTLKENIYWIKQMQLGDKRGNHIKLNPYPRYYYPYRCVEPIYLFQKRGRIPARKKKEIDRLPDNIVRDWSVNHWHVAARESEHPAAFPEELAERLIRLYTETGERVGDPFAGSGTVMAVARKWSRSSWSYEVNSQFIKLIKDRMKWGQFDVEYPEEVKYNYVETRKP